MKKHIILLLAALCALLPACAALAEGTTLRTQVPSTHAITIHCEGNGDVEIDGKRYSGAFTVEAKRLGTMEITAYPDSGYGLYYIVAEDLDGVTIKGKKATLTNVHDENELIFSFYKLREEQNTSGGSSSGGSSSGSSTSGDAASDILDVSELPILSADMFFIPMPQIDTPILGETTLADVVTLLERKSADNLLYDEYFGTGGGLNQLHIVFNGEYEPEDYELLDLFIDDETQGNSILVCAFPDEAGKTEQRSVILSAEQLVKFAQNRKIEHIIFENGDAIVEMDMVDVIGGDLAKLMALILKGEETITSKTLERDWSAVEPVVIPAAYLAKIELEICVAPVEMENGDIGYEVSVWLHWGDQSLDVSGMIPSLAVGIAVDDLVTQENFDSFTSLYTLAHRVYDADAMDDEQPGVLPSALMLIPGELPAHQDDVAEHFIVAVKDSDDGYPVTAYEASAHLVPYRHYVLAADHVGEGIYMVYKTK